MPTDHRIGKKDAEDEIKRYSGMAAEAISPQYYNSLPKELQDYLVRKIYSCVFRKAQLDAMFPMGTDANAVRVYFAAKMGAAANPSMVAVACYINDDETSVQNRLPSAPYDGGIQYPIVRQGTLPFDLATD